MVKLEEFIKDLEGLSIVLVMHSSKLGDFQLHAMLDNSFKITSGGKDIFKTDDAEEVVNEFNRLTN